MFMRTETMEEGLQRWPRVKSTCSSYRGSRLVCPSTQMSYNPLLFQFHTGTVVTRGIPGVRLSPRESGLTCQSRGVLRKSLSCDFPLHEDDLIPHQVGVKCYWYKVNAMKIVACCCCYYYYDFIWENKISTVFSS